MKKITVSLLSCIILSLMGCAITGRVSTATYNLPLPDSTFAIFSDTMSTLTEQKIQKHIITKLTSLGLKQTDDFKKADHIVVYSYNVGSGQTYVSSSPDFVFGGQKVSSHTEYPRYFQIGLVDREASIKANKIIYTFQGEVYSSGSSSNVAYLAKYFVDQIFLNYGQDVNDKPFIVSP